MGETGFCKNLQFSAVSCENLRFPAVFCANLRLPNPLIYRASRKSAKICKNLRKCAFRVRFLPFAVSLLARPVFCKTWWTFRPRKKIFTPPPQIPQTSSRPLGPAPLLETPPPPPPGIFHKKSIPSPPPGSDSPFPLTEPKKKYPKRPPFFGVLQRDFPFLCVFLFSGMARQTKPKKGEFMNFSQGRSGTKVQCESC